MTQDRESLLGLRQRIEKLKASISGETFDPLLDIREQLQHVGSGLLKAIETANDEEELVIAIDDCLDRIKGEVGKWLCSTCVESKSGGR